MAQTTNQPPQQPMQPGQQHPQQQQQYPQQPMQPGQQPPQQQHPGQPQPGQQPQQHQQPAQPGQQPATPPHEAQHADPARGQQTIQTSHVPDEHQRDRPKSVEERLAAIEANLERLIPLIGSTTEAAQPHMTQQPQVQPAGARNPAGGQRG
jgi:hypothetical protein